VFKSMNCLEESFKKFKYLWSAISVHPYSLLLSCAVYLVLGCYCLKMFLCNVWFVIRYIRCITYSEGGQYDCDYLYFVTLLLESCYHL
jgi:hypothetical protein